VLLEPSHKIMKCSLMLQADTEVYVFLNKRLFFRPRFTLPALLFLEATVSAMALQTKVWSICSERQAATVLLNQSWAWRKFTPIQIFIWTACEGYGKKGAMGSHWNWETRIMTFGYPNLVLVSLLAIEFSVNSRKHSTRTLGLVQNWVSAFHTQI
jgi:hypothetical protein